MEIFWVDKCCQCCCYFLRQGHYYCCSIEGAGHHHVLVVWIKRHHHCYCNYYYYHYCYYHYYLTVRGLVYWRYVYGVIDRSASSIPSEFQLRVSHSSWVRSQRYGIVGNSPIVWYSHHPTHNSMAWPRRLVWYSILLCELNCQPGLAESWELGGG